jgi:predicted esterase
LAPRGRVSENGANRFFRRFAEGVFDVDDLRLQTHALADWVRESAQQYGFDGAKVWALGYSNGANIAASALLLRPELFAGAVLLRAMTPFEPDVAPDLTSKPVLLAAGELDPIVPLPNVRRLSEILETAGAQVTLRFEPTGHNLGAAELEFVGRWIGENAPGD